MTDSDANRKFVQHWWDALNQPDMAAAAEFFAEDTRNVFCGLPLAFIVC